MGVGRELVGQVAQVVLDLAEGLVLRQIDEAFGHLAEDAFGIGPQLLEEVLDTGFAVLCGLRRSRNGSLQHGVRPGVGSHSGFEIPHHTPSYQKTRNFSPTFVKHTLSARLDSFRVEIPAAAW